MNKTKSFFKFVCFQAILAAVLILPDIVSAQYFYDSASYGDVDAGFRKTGTYQEQYEMVAYLGNITNFLQVPPGVTINITNYLTKQLTNMCPDGFGHLQWSVFSSFNVDPLSTYVGNYPGGTCWYTVPRTNINIQTKVPARNNYSASGLLSSSIYSVADGAHALSNQIANQNGNTNINNNTFVLLEPISLAGSDEELTSYIGDSGNSSLGDFNTLAYSVENVTSNTFAAPAVSDFYQSVPNSSSSFGPFVDPITGTTNGPAYWVGYFTLNVNGSMTFTRASSVAPPSAGGVTSSGTNGFSPLKVIFTNSASGNITNWVWNFGNGTSITNTTGGPVTNTYAAAGNYTVTLTVYGPGGSSTVTLGNYIVISATPQIKAYLAAGKFVLTGTNLPSAVQYRILNTTNLSQSVGGWQPVLTNTFLANGTFWYTNSATNLSGFFRLVSP